MSRPKPLTLPVCLMHPVVTPFLKATTRCDFAAWREIRQHQLDELKSDPPNCKDDAKIAEFLQQHYLTVTPDYFPTLHLVSRRWSDPDSDCVIESECFDATGNRNGPFAIQFLLNKAHAFGDRVGYITGSYLAGAMHGSWSFVCMYSQLWQGGAGVVHPMIEFPVALTIPFRNGQIDGQPTLTEFIDYEKKVGDCSAADLESMLVQMTGSIARQWVGFESVTEVVDAISTFMDQTRVFEALRELKGKHTRIEQKSHLAELRVTEHWRHNAMSSNSESVISSEHCRQLIDVHLMIEKHWPNVPFYVAKLMLEYVGWF